MGKPSLYAVDLLARTTAAAPSDIWELFPAVVEPFFLKAGLSLPRLSIVVAFLIPSSSSHTTSFYYPLASFTLTAIGIISSTIETVFYF